MRIVLALVISVGSGCLLGTIVVPDRLHSAPTDSGGSTLFQAGSMPLEPSPKPLRLTEIVEKTSATTTPYTGALIMTLLNADRLLSSIVRHLRADGTAALASYRYDDVKAANGAVELVKSAHLQVRAEILNISVLCITAADVPSCYPGFENNAPLV